MCYGHNLAPMNFELRREIPADHPTLPGHFPGAPIVPAVVILDEVLAAVDKWRADSRLVAIRVAKFLAPLKPEQPFAIVLSAANNVESEIHFRCRVDERIVAEGRLEMSQRTN
jgi:3-hydroxymyristoyl/3-hydroxydecanoyl-(acyl carrier protein) dehydratase